MSRALDRRRLLASLAPAIGLVLALGAAAPLSAAQAEVPYLSGRVVDEAGMLQPGTADGLTTSLEDLEQATGAQVAVLTVPTLDGMPIEDYALAVAETWKLGRADQDDGVLFLIVRDDRLMRIEVGYGLEPVIPDILAGRILDQVVRPRFRQGEFDAGVSSGVGAISALIRGSEPAEVLPARSGRDPFTAGCLQLVLWLTLLVFIVLMNRRRRGGGGFIFLPSGGGFSGGRSSGWSGGGFSGGFSGGGGSFGGGGASSSW